MIISEAILTSASRGEAPATQVVVLNETNALLERIAVALEALVEQVSPKERDCNAFEAGALVGEDVSDSQTEPAVEPAAPAAVTPDALEQAVAELNAQNEATAASTETSAAPTVE